MARRDHRGTPTRRMGTPSTRMARGRNPRSAHRRWNRSSPVILSKQQANAIASGRKTTHHTTNDALRVGARFNVNWRDGKQLVKTCYAQIVAREERQLRDLSRDEAKREGFPGVRGPLDFRRAWLEANGRYNVKDFTDEAIAKFYASQTGKCVYVLTLQLAEEPDQWMARSTGRLTKHQATSNPRDAIDELPLAPQAFVDAEAKRIYEQSQTTRAQTRRAEAAERFAQTEARARAAGLDTRRPVRSVEQITAALERRIPRHEAM